jgi:hypothetical protein
LGAAKGYRPLYHLLEDAVRRAVPDLHVVPQATHIAFGAPNEFMVVVPQATEIRLGVALGGKALEGGWQKPRMRGVGAGITHMQALTDARQVNADLLNWIKEAAALANP